MTYLLGQAPMEPCPICDMSPVALEPVAEIPELATCARCAFAYVVQTRDGRRYNHAEVAIPVGFWGIYRRYWNETQRKVGLPEYLFEGELEPATRARTQAMNEWLANHSELVAAATAPMTYPYASVTVTAVDVLGEMKWSVASPPAGLQHSPLIPFKPEGLPPGTIVTIQIPLVDPVHGEYRKADPAGHS